MLCSHRIQNKILIFFFLTKNVKYGYLIDLGRLKRLRGHIIARHAQQQAGQRNAVLFHLFAIRDWVGVRVDHVLDLQVGVETERARDENVEKDAAGFLCVRRKRRQDEQRKEMCVD